MILIPNLNPLHMDPDPQVDPDPEVDPNANSICTGGKSCKSPHSYVHPIGSEWSYLLRNFANFGGSGYPSGSVVGSGSSDGADSTEDLNPGYSNSGLFSHDGNSRSESIQKTDS